MRAKTWAEIAREPKTITLAPDGEHMTLTADDLNAGLRVTPSILVESPMAKKKPMPGKKKGC